MSVMTSKPPSPIRSSSGFSLFAKIRSNKDAKQPTPGIGHARRSSSYGSNHSQPTRSSPFSSPAQEGSGAKARRLSVDPRDDFIVDVCPLEEEFVSASKIGRRKEIGKGASSTVKVMQ